MERGSSSCYDSSEKKNEKKNEKKLNSHVILRLELQITNYELRMNRPSNLFFSHCLQHASYFD